MQCSASWRTSSALTNFPGLIVAGERRSVAAVQPRVNGSAVGLRKFEDEFQAIVSAVR